MAVAVAVVQHAALSNKMQAMSEAQAALEARLAALEAWKDSRGGATSSGPLAGSRGEACPFGQLGTAAQSIGHRLRTVCTPS